MAGEKERVILMGGGATSALIAIRLAQRGFALTLLQQTAIGQGSSSRSNAGIRAQFGVEATACGMMYSEDWYTHFHDLLETPLERRQPVIHQNGYLFLYEDPERAAPPWRLELRASAAAAWERAQQYAAMQRRIGLPVELLNPSAIGGRWPYLDCNRLIGATYCATDGFLQPHVILHEGYRRARELGVEVLSKVEVVGATLRGGRIAEIETTQGALEADWYVNATNAWAPRV